MISRWRAALGDAALVLGSVSLVLVGLESALRVTGFVPERERAVRRMVDARWTTLLDCFPSNPRGYFDIDLRRPENETRYRRLAPLRFDAMTRHHPWALESRYNSLRFRDAPLGPKPRGVRRVVILGDSFAEGQGVKEADTLARVLARLLEERAPGRYDVRNCGRRGADFPGIYEAFDDVLPYEPDVVVYTLTLNDAVQPPGFRARQTYLNDWILDRTNAPADPDAPQSLLRPRVFDFVSDRLEAVDHRPRDHALVPRHVERREPRGLAEDTGVRARDEAAARPEGGSAPRRALAALRLPRARLSVRRRRTRRSTPSAREPGSRHHDLLPVFQGRRTSDFWVHPVDHHPNERAHRLAAESLLTDVLTLAGN